MAPHIGQAKASAQLDGDRSSGSAETPDEGIALARVAADLLPLECVSPTAARLFVSHRIFLRGGSLLPGLTVAAPPGAPRAHSGFRGRALPPSPVEPGSLGFTTMILRFLATFGLAPIAGAIMAAEPRFIVSHAPSEVVGEGDTMQLTVRLDAPVDETVYLAPRLHGRDGPEHYHARWLPGESGERSFEVVEPDDVVVLSDQVVELQLHRTGDFGTSLGIVWRHSHLRLDNDRPEMRVLRHHRGAPPGLPDLGGVPLALVLDGGRTYAGAVQPEFVCVYTRLVGPMTLYGNRATLVPGMGGCGALATYDGHRGTVELRDIELLGLAPPVPGSPDSPRAFAEYPLQGEGNLILRRSRIAHDLRQADPAADFSRVGLLRASAGRAELDRVRLEALDATADTVMSGLSLSGTDTVVSGSVVQGVDAAAQLRLQGGSVALRDSTLVAPSGTASVLQMERGATARAARTLMQGREGGAPLCRDGATVQSEGYNMTSDTSCGLADSSDRAVQLDLAAPDTTGIPWPVGAAIDGGGSDCGPVDLRGAPRPQTLVPGGQPRCDIGAIEHGINPYRGLWQPERSGHGVELHTAGNRLLLLWYTYGDDGQPTAFQAVAPLQGPHWEAPLLQPRRDPATGSITIRLVGRVSLDFASDVDARLGWRFDAGEIQGSERLRPALFAAGEPRVEVGGVWYAPLDSGYGVSVTRRGGTTAAILYYYDAAGHSRWALATGPASDAASLELSSFTGFCPDCDAATIPVRSRPAGRIMLHFLTPDAARLDTQVTYPHGDGGSWMRTQAMLARLSDPVDNRVQAAALHGH